jgi:hypothetical protein
MVYFIIAATKGAFQIGPAGARKTWDIPVRFLCGLCEKLCISFAVIFYRKVRKVLRKGAQSRVKGVYIIVAGWWAHQPGRPVVGGVLTAHMKQSDATI